MIINLLPLGSTHVTHTNGYILHLESRKDTTLPILQTHPSCVCPCEKINHSSVCKVEATLGHCCPSIKPLASCPMEGRVTVMTPPTWSSRWPLNHHDKVMDILCHRKWNIYPPDCRWADTKYNTLCYNHTNLYMPVWVCHIVLCTIMPV